MATVRLPAPACPPPGARGHHHRRCLRHRLRARHNVGGHQLLQDRRRCSISLLLLHLRLLCGLCVALAQLVRPGCYGGGSGPPRRRQAPVDAPAVAARVVVAGGKPALRHGRGQAAALSRADYGEGAARPGAGAIGCCFSAAGAYLRPAADTSAGCRQCATGCGPLGEGPARRRRLRAGGPAPRQPCQRPGRSLTWPPGC